MITGISPITPEETSRQQLDKRELGIALFQSLCKSRADDVVVQMSDI